MKAQKRWRSSLVIGALVSAGIVAACTARLGDPSPGFGFSSGSSSGTANGAGSSGGGGAASGGSSGGAASGGTSSGASTPPPVSTSTPPVPESAGLLVMRRLTNREYDNMMADLLGDTTAPGTTFPQDVLGVTGFEAPNSVADLNVQYYNQTADTLAEAALAAGKLSIPCQSPAATAESACATQFVTQFGQSAYRRPLAAAEQTDLLTLFSTVRGLGLSFNESIAALVKAMIQSPNFLYHWEIGPTKPVVGSDGLVPLTPWQVASRLAESLWESMPDATLLSAAQAGQLSTPAQVTAQAQRMLSNNAHASNALFNFHEQWLLQVNGHVTDINQIVKSSSLFTAAVQQSLGTEFTQFLSSVYVTGDGTLNTLFTAPYAMINQALGPIYGVTGPATGFAKVALDPTQRAGILTQSAFLASNADPSTDNPVRRGLAIYINVLCGSVMPPPANVPSVSFMAGGTTRQAFEAHAQSACAQGCHSLFDPPGFAFENYDAIGAYRTTEAGQPVNSTGTFTTPGGATISFQNGVDLAKQLAQSSEAAVCVDRQWVRYMLGRMETMAEQGSLELAYQNGAATTGFSLRNMLTTLVSSKAYLYRTPSPGEPL